jgi:hypothetical protein
MEHDHTQSLRICKNLADVTQELDDSAEDAGCAYAVRKFISHRIDNVLAKYANMTHALDSRGKPRAMSIREFEARNNPDFHKEFEELWQQFRDSEIIIKQWEAREKRFESARSQLSFSKTTKDKGY